MADAKTLQFPGATAFGNIAFIIFLIFILIIFGVGLFGGFFWN